jgi:hypothetical protein
VVVVAGFAGVEIDRLMALDTAVHGICLLGQDIPGIVEGQARRCKALYLCGGGHDSAPNDQHDQEHQNQQDAGCLGSKHGGLSSILDVL